MDSETIYLFRCTVYDPLIPGEKILYYCTGSGVVVGDIFYEPRISNPGSFQSAMFGSGKTGGASQTSYGVVDLVNADGGLDALIDYGYGRGFEIDRYQNGVVTPALSGTTEQPVFSLETISFRIKDSSQVFNSPIQPTLYLGNNALPAGLEGGADMKDKPKPRCFGSVLNATIPCVNTSRLIYQGNDGAVSFVNVYDNAVALTKGADYTSQADMEANAPAAGYYRQWIAGGYCRLGSAPAGAITADLLHGATDADRTIAQIGKALAAEKIGSGSIVERSITKLDAAMPYVVGLYTGTTEMTVAAALDMICKPDIWWGFDADSKFWIKQVNIPLPGSIIGVLDDTKILSLERQATSDADRGVPCWKVDVQYGKNWTVQKDGIAGSITASRRDFLANEYRDTVATNESIQVIHPMATVLIVPTLLTSEIDAQVEASRKLSTYSVRKDLLKIKVPSSLRSFSLGEVVCMKYPRYGYSAGRATLIVGIESYFKINETTLTLWGTSAPVSLYFKEDYFKEDYYLQSDFNSCAFVGPYFKEDYFKEDYFKFI